MADGKIEVTATLKDKISGGLRKIRNVAGKLGGAFKVLALVGVAAIAAIGFVAIKAAIDFQKAFNTIRVGTGASGEAFEELKDDFKAVMSTVPQGMDEVASSIADFNTLLGFSGPLLQDLAKDALNASRIVGVDSKVLIENYSRALNAMGASEAEAAVGLDIIFKVSQDTGVGMDALSKKVQTFGPVLKNLGLNFAETTVFIGQMQKGGIDLTRVLPGINAFMRKAATGGVQDLRKALSEQMKIIKEATTDTDALKVAVEAFGSEGAMRMVTGIRAGSISLDGLLDSLDGAEGGIQRFSDETLTLTDKWKIFKNKVLVQFEPLLTSALAKLEEIMDKVLPILEEQIPKAVEKVNAALETGKEAWAKFQRGLDVVRPAVMRVIGAMRLVTTFLLDHKDILLAVAIALVAVLIPGIVAWTVATVANTVAHIALAVATLAAYAPLLLLIAAIALLAFGIIQLVKHWDEISAFIVGVWTVALDFVVEKLTWVRDTLLEIVGRIVSFLKENWQKIVLAVLAILFPPGAGLFLIITNFTKIKDKVIEVLGALLSALKTALSDMVSAITGAAESFLTEMGSMATRGMGAFMRGIGSTIQIGKNIVTGLVGGLLAMGPALLKAAIDIGKKLFEGLKKGAGKAWPFSPSEAGVDIGKGLIDGLVLGVKDNLSRVTAAAASIQAAVNVGMPAFTIDAGRQDPNRIFSAVTNALAGLRNPTANGGMSPLEAFNFWMARMGGNITDVLQLMMQGGADFAPILQAFINAIAAQGLAVVEDLSVVDPDFFGPRPSGASALSVAGAARGTAAVMINIETLGFGAGPQQVEELVDLLEAEIERRRRRGF